MSGKPVIIAEKAKMAKGIASHLGGAVKTHKGWMETDTHIVTHAIGHVLELAMPDAYGDEFKSFPGTLSSLPVTPHKWKMVQSKGKSGQIATIKRLAKATSLVIHAGDPDREGQLIVDEILEHIGYKGKVKRILLPDTKKNTVINALSKMQDNRDFHGQSLAARSRSRADWLIGMNVTRAMCIHGRANGYPGVLSVGRIQTPTLAITVKREREIESFKPQDFFSLDVDCSPVATPSDHFVAKWVFSFESSALALSGEADEAPEDMDDDVEERLEEMVDSDLARSRPDWLDDKGRISDYTKAKDIKQQISKAKDVKVVDVENQEAFQSPPSLFDLDKLGAEVESQFGITGSENLAACQKLYEKGYQSYPRTDSSYLREELRFEVPDVLAAISESVPGLKPLVGITDPKRESKIWNDDKCKAHYAIIPTDVQPDFSSLSKNETLIWKTVALRYVMQFLADCVVDKTTIKIKADSHCLVARGNVIKKRGWRVASSAKPAKGGDQAKLPQMSSGDDIKVGHIKLGEHKTTPPSRYTEGSLKAIMKKCYKLLPLSDKEGRKKLKDTEGIGTSATRTPAIKSLLDRELLKRKSGRLHPTDVGIILVDNAPKMLTSPLLTAQWEKGLEFVENGKLTSEKFDAKQLEFLGALMKTMQVVDLSELKKLLKGPAKTGKSASPGLSEEMQSNVGSECSKCKKGNMLVRVVKKAGKNKGKQFLSCSNFPECKNAIWP